ncbi:uncharacterized protein LOC135934362 [Cloeon dipterum]|uniref:uncharacterized protein LOC135934362 n=1 Tax=Cloeon dipterum TaxID=197152 RepID=UPI00321FDB1B
MAQYVDNSWRRPAFRRHYIVRIEEEIRDQIMATPIKTIIEIESQIFQKSTNREEYLGYFERIMVLVKTMRPNPLLATGRAYAEAQMKGQQPQQGMMPGQLQTNPQQGQISPATTPGNSEMAKEWMTSEFRHNVIENLDEEIRITGISYFRSSVEIESIFYEKSQNQLEYLVTVARFILHVRLMSIYAAVGGSIPRVPQETPNSQNPGGNGTDQQPLSQSQNTSAASDIDITDLMQGMYLH